MFQDKKKILGERIGKTRKEGRPRESSASRGVFENGLFSLMICGYNYFFLFSLSHT